MPTDDDPEQQSGEEPADEQPSAQSDEAPAESGEPSTAEPDTGEQSTPQSDTEPAEQSGEQPAQSDQTVPQSEEQPADQSDQTEHPSDDQLTSDSDQTGGQPEEEPADSDQPTTAATADDTQEFAAGDAFPAGGGGALGGGLGKTTKVQVIAKFMTDNANDPFKEGSITMNVFDGEKGTLLWKLGSMDQQKVTFQDAAVTSNVIKSAMFSGVTGNSVKVELRVRMLEPDHEADPDIPQVNFGTAAKFEVPAKGTLNVDVDVEVTEKEFTVEAKDEGTAGDAARAMLANIEEIQLSRVKSATNVGGGKFRVVFRIPTKKILLLHPSTLEVIY